MIAIFDADCLVCDRWVRFVIRHDRAGRIRFATARSEYGARILRQLGEDPDDPATIVLVDGDDLYVRSDAMLKVMGVLRWPWRAAGMFSMVPRPLRDMAYNAFARRRYRLFGRIDTCAVRPAPAPDRFVE